MKIEITNLTKKFGEKTAVEIDSFTVNKGDILGLVGNNGAGKTTLFRLILDLLKADTGNVSLVVPLSEGENPTFQTINPTESEAWKAFTGAYIDEGFLIDFLTPEEYFQFIGKVNDLPKEETDARLEEFTHLMGGEIMGRKNFSGTSRQATSRKSALSRPCSTARSCSSSTSRSTSSTPQVRPS